MIFRKQGWKRGCESSKLGDIKLVGRDVGWEDNDGRVAWMLLLLRWGKAVPQAPWGGGLLSLINWELDMVSAAEAPTLQQCQLLGEHQPSSHEMLAEDLQSFRASLAVDIQIQCCVRPGS